MKKRKRSEAVKARDQLLLERIEALKADHPFWGYRRIWAYLKYRENIHTTKNRIYRVMKEHQLLAKNQRNLRASRVPMPSKPRSQIPNKLWGIDMTKIMVESWGWVYLHVVLDWASKKVVGWHLAPTSKTDDWLKALDQAMNTQFPKGREKPKALNLVSDNGCQPTSHQFMKTCSVLGIHQIFTSYNNPKGNADTERVMRTLKEDCVWLQEWTSFQQLHNALSHWVQHYNEVYPHSSIGYLAPIAYESNYCEFTT